MGVRNWWLDSGSTSTGGFLEADDLKAGAVTTAKIAAQNVTSEKASDNLQTRSIAVPLSSRVASSSGGYSSTYVVWQPLVPITLERVTLHHTAAWIAATSGTFATLYRNSSSSVADFTFETTAAIAAGERRASGSLVVTQVAAQTNLTLKWNVSTCDTVGATAVVFDYTTTD